MPQARTMMVAVRPSPSTMVDSVPATIRATPRRLARHTKEGNLVMTAPTASPARMSASASLLTGKNRRRALQALIAAPLLALGIAAGSGTAHAVTGIFAPGEVRLADGHCAVSGWPHGE